MHDFTYVPRGAPRDDARHLPQAAADLSEESFRKVWDNEDDAAYDEL